MTTQTFYTDAALTTPLAAALSVLQKTDDSLPPADLQLWLGHDNAAEKLQASSDPGVDQITISIVDSASGSGNPTTAVKLATTQLGLDSAVAGDPLNAGTTIVGGAGGAFEFWARVDDQTYTVGTYTDLSIQTNDLDILPV